MTIKLSDAEHVQITCREILREVIYDGFDIFVHGFDNVREIEYGYK